MVSGSVGGSEFAGGDPDRGQDTGLSSVVLRAGTEERQNKSRLKKTGFSYGRTVALEKRGGIFLKSTVVDT